MRQLAIRQNLCINFKLSFPQILSYLLRLVSVNHLLVPEEALFRHIFKRFENL